MSGGGSAWTGRDAERLAREWGVPAVEVHGRIGSTNDRAAELVADGAAPWTVVVADEQTRGRGRRGSSWTSAPGSGLLMSVVLGGGVGLGRTPSGGLPLLVGLACAEGIESRLPELDVGLKWPNDLVLGGRKVGGILCEAVDHSLVVGIGINVKGAPDVASAPDGSVSGLGSPPRGSRTERRTPPPLPATSLEIEAGVSVDRAALASAILRRLRLRLDEVTAFHRVLPELRRRDVLEGRIVETEQAGRGSASGIDGSGALLLTRADGSEVRVVAGSVRLSDPRNGPVQA